MEPHAGQPFYTYFNGELETVFFIKENIADGASVPTYVFRDANNRTLRCAVDMYVPTKRIAMKRYLEECKSALSYQQKRIVEASEDLVKVTNEISRVSAELNSPSLE